MKLFFRNKSITITSVFLLLYSFPAFATVVFDQAQIGWSPSSSPYDIGGHLRQELAQTYTAGVSGTLDRVELVVSCEDSSVGDLHIEIQTVTPTGEPSGTVLGASAVDSQTLPDHDGANYEITAFSPVDVDQEDGTMYAIVMRGDEGTICYTPRGAVSGSMFTYHGGTALIGDTSGGTVSWSETSDPVIDFAFFTFVRINGPDFCDITDVAGNPNDWLPESVPACGCLEDPVFNAHRCWFGLPDFVLWREIAPFGDPKAKVEWQLLPLNSGILEVRVQEFSDQATGPELVFDGTLTPGKSEKIKLDALEYGDTSEVAIEFIGPRGDATVIYEVIQNISDQ